MQRIISFNPKNSNSQGGEHIRFIIRPSGLSFGQRHFSQNNANGKLLVRLTGLLLFDSKHFFEAGLPRDTNWEIHPVLKMEYCPKGKTCRADSDEFWKDLDNELPP